MSVPSTLFTSVRLDESSEDCIGQREFGKVLSCLLFHLICFESGYVPTSAQFLRATYAGLLTRLFEHILGLYFHDSSLIRDTRHELIVYNSNAIVFNTAFDDQIGNASGICKCRNVTSDLVERHREVLGEGTGELGFGFVPDNHDGRVRIYWVLLVGYGATSEFGDGGVDTTTEAFVRRDNDEQFVLGRIIHWGVLEYLCKGLIRTFESPDTKWELTRIGDTILLAVGHGSLCLGQLCRCNHLHRLHKTTIR